MDHRRELPTAKKEEDPVIQALQNAKGKIGYSPEAQYRRLTGPDIHGNIAATVRRLGELLSADPEHVKALDDALNTVDFSSDLKTRYLSTVNAIADRLARHNVGSVLTSNIESFPPDVQGDLKLKFVASVPKPVVEDAQTSGPRSIGFHPGKGMVGAPNHSHPPKKTP